MRDLKTTSSFKKKIRNFKKTFLIFNKLRLCKKNIVIQKTKEIMEC